MSFASWSRNDKHCRRKKSWSLLAKSRCIRVHNVRNLVYMIIALFCHAGISTSCRRPDIVVLHLSCWNFYLIAYSCDNSGRSWRKNGPRYPRRLDNFVDLVVCFYMFCTCIDLPFLACVSVTATAEGVYASRMAPGKEYHAFTCHVMATVLLPLLPCRGPCVAAIDAFACLCVFMLLLPCRGRCVAAIDAMSWSLCLCYCCHVVAVMLPAIVAMSWPLCCCHCCHVVATVLLPLMPCHGHCVYAVVAMS